MEIEKKTIKEIPEEVNAYIVTDSKQVDFLAGLVSGGWLIPQENVFGVELPDNVLLFVDGFRARNPEMDFNTPLLDVVRKGLDMALNEADSIDCWLVDYLSYIGALTAVLGGLTLQVSRRRKVKIENKSSRDTDAIIRNLLYLCGRMGYSHSQQKKIREKIREEIQ